MIDYNYNNKYSKKLVTPERMIEVWKMLRTPVLRGAVMEFDDMFTDCPGVFRHNDKWYMIFIAIFKDAGVSGYETHLAESDDLVHRTEWLADPTVAPSSENKSQNAAAHKPWIITWEGHVYYFYCACTDDNRRYIAWQQILNDKKLVLKG